VLQRAQLFAAADTRCNQQLVLAAPEQAVSEVPAFALLLLLLLLRLQWQELVAPAAAGVSAGDAASNHCSITTACIQNTFKNLELKFVSSLFAMRVLSVLVVCAAAFVTAEEARLHSEDHYTSLFNHWKKAHDFSFKCDKQEAKALRAFAANRYDYIIAMS
jgi:hypothetical protein